MEKIEFSLKKKMDVLAKDVDLKEIEIVNKTKDKFKIS